MVLSSLSYTYSPSIIGNPIVIAHHVTWHNFWLNRYVLYRVGPRYLFTTEKIDPFPFLTTPPHNTDIDIHRAA